VYTYPFVSELSREGLTKKSYHKNIFLLLRFIVLASLMLLVMRPQFVDETSHVNIEGVDIVLAIDVSDSMRIFDDLKDRRTRIEVATQEAIRFIEKRVNDPISIVIFARDALSRCPLTVDKRFLKELVGSLKIGVINHAGTFLGTGLALAVNRLKDSKAKSKIIILLTDGEPTPPEKIEPDAAIALAKEFGVKVYTVGIGNKKGGYLHHPFGGLQRVGINFNTKLLKKIANETGGTFFRANNPKEMRAIYDTIDTLEKTEYETDVFHNYYEAFARFIWLLLLLLGIELFLRLFVWRGVS